MPSFSTPVRGDPIQFVDGDVPFRRPLDLLRGTQTRLALGRVQFWGGPAEGCDEMLGRLFGDEALIERLDDESFALLFVSRPEDERCVEMHVLRHLLQALRQPGRGGSCRATVSMIHQDATNLGAAEDLMATLASEAKTGASIVTL
ncbi:MAG: hypothetical protein HKM95_17530 [Inquilinus sp.]|nr:hypothetical protein [Inquilinus sp.]